MAKDSSFDVVSQIDLQEVDNAYGPKQKRSLRNATILRTRVPRFPSTKMLKLSRLKRQVISLLNRLWISLPLSL